MVVDVVVLLWMELDTHEHGVSCGIGEVIGRDPIATALCRADDPAVERPRIGCLDRVGHVARLEVGEVVPVRHDELQGFDIGVIRGRVIDVAQHPIRDREPDL